MDDPSRAPPHHEEPAKPRNSTDRQLTRIERARLMIPRSGATSHKVEWRSPMHSRCSLGRMASCSLGDSKMSSDSPILAGTSRTPRRGIAFGLAPRIMALSVSGIVLLGVCVTGVAWYLLERAAIKAATERVETNMRVAWDVLRAHGKSFSMVDGKLLASDHVLNGDAELVDKVKSLVGGTCTVFMKDLRVTTNVMKPDGTRAVGTRLAPGGAYDAIFDRKAPFRGEIQILGEPYITAYDPILDPNGEVLGILYVGVKKVEFLESARSTFWTIIYSTLAISALAMLVSYLVVRNAIVRPLKASVAVMNRLARGRIRGRGRPDRRDRVVGFDRTRNLRRYVDVNRGAGARNHLHGRSGIR